MDSSTISAREEQTALLATDLVPQAALLTRHLARQLRSGLSRSEARVLSMLSAAPRRITELAELDGVAQPTMTVLVKRLEVQGLVSRARQPEDERVVIVRITEAGAAAHADYRALIGTTMRGYLAQMSDQQVQALAEGAAALDALIDLIQDAGAR
jgi:DNA-binding MarR family transcriptional regulator